MDVFLKNAGSFQRLLLSAGSVCGQRLPLTCQKLIHHPRLPPCVRGHLTLHFQKTMTLQRNLWKGSLQGDLAENAGQNKNSAQQPQKLN